MKIPDKLNILGYEYVVKISKNFKEEIKPHLDANEDADSFSGYFSTDANTIWIDGNTTGQNQISCFLHEVVEIINAHLALNICHDNIERLETALYQVLITNKMLR